MYLSVPASGSRNGQFPDDGKVSPCTPCRQATGMHTVRLLSSDRCLVFSPPCAPSPSRGPPPLRCIDLAGCNKTRNSSSEPTRRARGKDKCRLHTPYQQQQQRTCRALSWTLQSSRPLCSLAMGLLVPQDKSRCFCSIPSPCRSLLFSFPRQDPGCFTAISSNILFHRMGSS